MVEGFIMMKCPSCDALYYMHGNFFEAEGQIIRASEKAWQDCEKCTAISKECGFQ